MMLLKSCRLRIGMDIRWKPESHMAHVNSSHVKKFNFLIDSLGNIELMISWLSGRSAAVYIYTCSFTLPRALICCTRLP